jgi:hypothetical protein
MGRLRKAFLTVPEAAYIVGVSPRMVQREIMNELWKSTCGTGVEAFQASTYSTFTWCDVFITK